MPVFYVDYRRDDGGLETDEDGVEFPNIEAAYLDAYHSAIDMWAEFRHVGRNLSGHQFLIRDENGRVLVELPFAEAVGAGGRTGR
jgi:hypothetical protein